jgi:hypothetical protein
MFLYDFIRTSEMCLVTYIVIPKKFNVPEFTKYIGLKCWETHMKIYYSKCRTRHRGGPKKYLQIIMEKEQISGIWFFKGKRSYLRSRHLVLWSLGTLIDQQRFYGSWLVTEKKKYYHPLNVLSEADCIAGFVLNC